MSENKNGDLVICGELDTNDPTWARHKTSIPGGMIIEIREI